MDGRWMEDGWKMDGRWMEDEGVDKGIMMVEKVNKLVFDIVFGTEPG